MKIATQTQESLQPTKTPATGPNHQTDGGRSAAGRRAMGTAALGTQRIEASTACNAIRKDRRAGFVSQRGGEFGRKRPRARNRRFPRCARRVAGISH